MWIYSFSYYNTWREILGQDVSKVPSLTAQEHCVSYYLPWTIYQDC